MAQRVRVVRRHSAVGRGASGVRRALDSRGRVGFGVPNSIGDSPTHGQIGHLLWPILVKAGCGPGINGGGPGHAYRFRHS